MSTKELIEKILESVAVASALEIMKQNKLAEETLRSVQLLWHNERPFVLYTQN